MQYVSHVERAVASAMPLVVVCCLAAELAARYYKGYDVRKRFANIDKWLSAYEELPHYMASKSDYYTHCIPAKMSKRVPEVWISRHSTAPASPTTVWGAWQSLAEPRDLD